MAEPKGPAEVDVEKIKKALVGAGILKSTKLSSKDEAHIREHLEKNGIDTRRFPFKITIICSSSHYCFIVKGL